VTAASLQERRLPFQKDAIPKPLAWIGAELLLSAGSGAFPGFLGSGEVNQMGEGTG
jgi:hypothetical protein